MTLNPTVKTETKFLRQCGVSGWAPDRVGTVCSKVR